MVRSTAFAALVCSVLLTLSPLTHAASQDDRSFAEGSRHAGSDDGGGAAQGADDSHWSAKGDDGGSPGPQPALAVPEPDTWAMLAIGLPLIGWAGARRRASRRPEQPAA